MTLEKDSPSLKKLQATSSRRVSNPKRAGVSSTGTEISQNVASTNVSSPILPASKARRQRTTTTSRTGVTGCRRVPDSSDDEFNGDDDFEPLEPDAPSGQYDSLGMPMVRRGNSTRKPAPAQRVGTPITEDSMMAALNDYEKDICERFMTEAKRLRGEIANKKGLRNESIFIDTILRKIGINLPTSESTHPI